MLLAIDSGNTNVVFAVFDGDKVTREDRAWLWVGAVDFLERAASPDEKTAVNLTRRRDDD